jgi:hypothetical protein
MGKNPRLIIKIGTHPQNKRPYDWYPEVVFYLSKLTPREQEAVRNFLKDRSNCELGKPSATIPVGPELTVLPTSVGALVSIRCPYCGGEPIDITDSNF